MNAHWFTASTLALAGLAGTGGDEKLPAAASGEESGSGLISLKLADEVTMKVFGRLFIDWGWFDGDEATYNNDTTGATPSLEAGTEFRAARLGVEGTLYEKTGYKVEFDFANGTTEAKDVFVTMKDTPAGELRIGHFKEPFSLEQLTSARFISFVERSVADAFAPGRNSGFQLSDTNGSQSMTWAAGLFKTTDDQAKGFGDSEMSATARVTGTAWNEAEGTDVLHFGGSVSYRKDNETRFRSRPEVKLGLNRPADTGALAADDTTLLGLESAWIKGRFSAQAEYQLASVSASSGGTDGDFAGYYAFVSWFLTGEHRNYKKSTGTFDRLKPAENFGTGRGAVELLARYSSLDLDDGPATGEMNDVTLGANWYLNPNSRVMLNLVHSEYEESGVDDELDALVVRFQVDW